MTRTFSLALICLLLCACDGSTGGAEPSSTDVADTERCHDNQSCNESENQGAQASDATSPSDPSHADDTLSEEGPLFELGTNVTGANTPDSFSPLVDGDELNIELGFQGLWMVVLSFRTRNIFKGKLTIITRIEADGEHQGELGLAKQKLIPSGGSLDYYYNLFLVVLDPSVSGQTGVITIRVSDDDGALVEETLEVQLTGGTSL